MIAWHQRLAILAVILLPSPLYAADEASTIKIEVARAGNAENESSINWEVRPIGENPVNADDFGGGELPSGALKFAAGEKSGNIEIQIQQDTEVEPDETFKVVLSNPESGSIISAEKLVTIVNDDEDTSTPLELSLSANKVSQIEVWSTCVPESFEEDADLICSPVEKITDGGGQIQNNEVTIEEPASRISTRLQLNVDASRATLDPYSVDYRVRGRGDHPVDGDDFGGTLPTGTITMASTSQSFTMDIQGDDEPEYSEGFLVELHNPGGDANLDNAVVRGTIKGERKDVDSPDAQAEEAGSAESRPLTVQNRDIKLFRVVPLDSGTNPFDFIDLENDIEEAQRSPDEPTAPEPEPEPAPEPEPEPEPEPAPEPDPGLTLISSLPVTDDNGDDSQFILIKIDASDNLSAVQGSMADTNTALELIGNPDVSFPGTANIFDTTAFTIIDPINGARLDENVNHEIILQRSNGDFYKLVLQFVQSGFEPGDVQLTDLSGFNCGSSQSDCP